MMTEAEVDVCYQGVKTRLKQLYKSEPVRFMQTLPTTPAQLVRDDRKFALTLFSREEPPVDCPLNNLAMDQVRAKVCMRKPHAGVITAAGTGACNVLFAIHPSGGDRFPQKGVSIHALSKAVSTALRPCMHS